MDHYSHVGHDEKSRPFQYMGRIVRVLRKFGTMHGDGTSTKFHVCLEAAT